MKQSDVIYTHTDEIVCQYCRIEFSDSYEYEAECGTITCLNCENDFQYQRHIEIAYSTKKYNYVRQKSQTPRRKATEV